MGAVLLETLSQPFFLVHQVTRPLSCTWLFCHVHDPANTLDVTGKSKPGRDNAQAAYRSTRAPSTGAMYSSGYGTCEYQCAWITVITAPAKYSTRPIPAMTPTTGTNSPASRPSAPAALAVP